MVTTHDYELKLVLTFADEDTRLLSIENPADSISAADSIAAAAIRDLNDYLYDNQIFISDNSGAAFNRIGSAKLVDRIIYHSEF